MEEVIPEYQPVLPDSRTVSHGILSSRMLERPSSTLLKFVVAVVIFALFPPLRTMSSPISWKDGKLLLPNLPLTFTLLTCSSLCLSNRLNKAPPYNRSLIICVRKLWPVHSRNLLNSLCPSARPLQQLSGWLYISLWCISYFKPLQCFETMFKKFLSS